MSYNHTYSQIKDILKQSKKVSKPMMLQIARLAIVETLGDRVKADDIESVSYTHLRAHET